MAEGASLGVDKLLDRVSLNDVLGVLAPGAVVVLSACSRFGWSVVDLLGPAVSGNSIVVAASFLIGTYAVGTLLAEWVNEGTRSFVHLHSKAVSHRANPRSAQFSVPERLWLSVVWLFHGMPLPRMQEESWVDSQVRMYQFNETKSHMLELSRVSSPWDRLELFRRLVSLIGLENSSVVLDGAAEVHGRLMYALCTSLALTVVAVGSLIDSAITFFRTWHVSQSIWVAVLSGLAACGLRWVAARRWEAEITLLNSLLDPSI